MSCPPASTAFSAVPHPRSTPAPSGASRPVRRPAPRDGRQIARARAALRAADRLEADAARYREQWLSAAPPTVRLGPVVGSRSVRPPVTQAPGRQARSR